MPILEKAKAIPHLKPFLQVLLPKAMELSGVLLPPTKLEVSNVFEKEPSAPSEAQFSSTPGLN
jgi:hypothetical protein